MSQTVTVRGQNYTIPDVGDTDWGQQVTDYLVAVAVSVAGSQSFMDYVSVASSPITVVSGKSYLVNTTSARSLQLPAPAANAFFLVKDVSGQAASNNITIVRNGSESIDGVAANKVLSLNGGFWMFMSDGTNWYMFHDAALTGSRALATDANGNIVVSAVTATELSYLSGVTSAIQAQINGKQATGNYITALTGEVTATGPGSVAATLSNAAVIGKVLTGYTAGAGTVTATDTILQAIQKLDGNDALRLLLAGGTMSGNIAMGGNKVTGLGAASANGDAARYEQVSPLWKYRKPVLVFTSVSTIDIEDGIVTGTSGDVSILFPDGKLITVNSSTQTRFDITRNCALSGTKQSGLRSSLSEGTNTWYFLYAVRATDNDDTFVVVGDTVEPLRANYSTLNSNFGTNKWVYLGPIRNGDGSGATSDIITFKMVGNMIRFRNNCAATGENSNGLRLANNAGVADLTWSAAIGTGASEVPANLDVVEFFITTGNTGAGVQLQIRDDGNAITYSRMRTDGTSLTRVYGATINGIRASHAGSANGMSIGICAAWDRALGVGSNPFL